MVSFKNIDICLIFGPKSIIFVSHFDKTYIVIHLFRRLIATSRAPNAWFWACSSDLAKLGQKFTKYGRGCPVGTRSPEPPQKFGHGP